MARRARRTPLRSLVRLVWLQPLWAIPFALFFGTSMGPSWTRYWAAYRISLVFAYVIGLAVWVVSSFVFPTTEGDSLARPKRPLWIEIATYIGSTLAASFVAAWIVHRALFPGFLGSARAFTMVGLYGLLFAILVTGIVYAYVFYTKALDRARSEQELHMARRIQRSFLLSQFPSMPRLEVHAVNVSSKEVSGDFYDVVPAGDGAFLMAIADVAGKGVPAALLSSMLQASLRTQAGYVDSVAQILRNLNTLTYRSTAVHQFATFFLARVEEPTMRLAYANAGHNHPILFRRDGRHRALDRGGTVVGILESVDFEEGQVALEPGDRVLLYTDGINEAEGPNGELFGEQRLIDLVRALPADLPASDTTGRILDGVRDFLAGREPGDDMTLLVLRVLEDGRSSRASTDG